MPTFIIPVRRWLYCYNFKKIFFKVVTLTSSDCRTWQCLVMTLCHRMVGVYERFNSSTVFIVWLQLNAVTSPRPTQRELSESWKSYKLIFKLSHYTGCSSESRVRYSALSARSKWGDAILEYKETKKKTKIMLEMLGCHYTKFILAQVTRRQRLVHPWYSRKICFL